MLGLALLSGSRLVPPRSRSAGEEAHTAEAGKVLWGPGSPSLLLPSLLFQPGPIAGSLTACGAFSQSPGARGKVGTGSARLVIVRSAFWLSKLQIRERLHGVSDNMF